VPDVPEAERAKESEPMKASAKWKAFQDGVKAEATRTANERARRDREVKDDTEYHRRAQATS
jgi:hypothetical protein